MSVLSYSFYSLILLLLLFAISIKVRGLRSLVSLIAVGLVMYVGLKFNLKNVLIISMANITLLIGALLLNVHRNLFGLSNIDIKNRGALISVPYLVVIGVISFSQCSVCYSLILLWVFLWYYFKGKCRNINLMCIVFLYIPTVVLVGIYKTPLALSYAIVTHWFQGEIESINEENVKRHSDDRGSVGAALDNIPEYAWSWKGDGN
ncbi:hypothetical protein [Thermococcus sp.]|uniref:hypothetical protein n=1 Tax=Thermococcus sp. TaxID=35749 RepID=UPI0026312AA3|nr:hypothetical protein [Thermococcus sp.]